MRLTAAFFRRTSHRAHSRRSLNAALAGDSPRLNETAAARHFCLPQDRVMLRAPVQSQWWGAMRTVAILICFAIFCAKTWSCRPAYAQGVEVVAVSELIKQIDNAVRSAVTALEASGSNLAFQVATDLNIFLRNFHDVADKLIGKTFKELTDQERKLFTDSKAMLEGIDASKDDSIKKVNDAISNLGQEISRLPYTDKQPMVSRAGPAYVMEDGEAIFIFRGSRLIVDESAMTFPDDNLCESIGTVDTELRFRCQTPPGNARHQAKLTLRTKKPWWNPFADDVVKKYAISVGVLQPEFATFSLTAEVDVTSNEVKARSQPNSHRNGKCEGATHKVWNYRPLNGCVIQEQSARVYVNSRKNSDCEGVTNLSPTGFSVRCVIRNSGKCILGNGDARGKVSVTAVWNDVCSKTDRVTMPEVTGSIYWGKDEPQVLPKDTKSWTLTVMRMDGNKRIFNSTGHDPWFFVDYAKNERMITIRPAAPTKALAALED
jgi:hypothetical protein